MAVQFESDEQARTMYNNLVEQNSGSFAPTMAAWLMQKGIAKTPEAANKTLIGIIVVCLLISVFFIFRMTLGQSSYVPNTEDLKLLEPHYSTQND